MQDLDQTGEDYCDENGYDSDVTLPDEPDQYTCSSGDEESRNDMDDIDGIIILRLFFISISTQKTLRHLDIFLMVRVSNYMNFT